MGSGCGGQGESGRWATGGRFCSRTRVVHGAVPRSGRRPDVPAKSDRSTGLQLWATLHVISCHLKTSSNSVIQKLRFFLPLLEGHELSNHGPYTSCARSSSVAASFMAGGAALRATSEILSVPLATRLVVGASPTHQPCGRTCVPLLLVPIRWCPPHSRESLRGRASVAGSLARRPQGSAPGCRDPKKVGAPSAPSLRPRPWSLRCYLLVPLSPPGFGALCRPASPRSFPAGHRSPGTNRRAWLSAAPVLLGIAGELYAAGVADGLEDLPGLFGGDDVGMGAIPEGLHLGI